MGRGVTVGVVGTVGLVDMDDIPGLRKAMNFGYGSSACIQSARNRLCRGDAERQVQDPVT